MSQVKFDGPPSPPSEPPGAERLRLARSALSLLNGPGASRWEPRWRYWVVAVERIGRVTLPADVRRVLGAGDFVSALTGDLVLLLRRTGVGARLSMDSRGRVVLPAWLRQTARSSGSVLVAARLSELPVVFIADTVVFDRLVDRVTVECR